MKPDTNAAFGVYTLANDYYMEWFIGFVESFRATNPSLPLTVIPYDDHVGVLRGLQDQYQFTLMDPVECRHFDELAVRVMGSARGAGMFRKWAACFGAYENFLFVDADVVVTSSLDALAAAFVKSKEDFLYFDTCMEHVYTPAFETEMRAQYHSVGFNAGAFVARKGVVSREQIDRISRGAAAVRHGFVEHIDQPFLNYVVDTSGIRVAHVNQVLPEAAASCMVWQPFVYDRPSGRVTAADGRPLLFVHWAGCVFPKVVKADLFLQYRTLGLTSSARLEYAWRFYISRFLERYYRDLLRKPLVRLVKKMLGRVAI